MPFFVGATSRSLEPIRAPPEKRGAVVHEVEHWRSSTASRIVAHAKTTPDEQPIHVLPTRVLNTEGGRPAAAPRARCPFSQNPRTARRASLPTAHIPRIDILLPIRPNPRTLAAHHDRIERGNGAAVGWRIATRLLRRRDGGRAEDARAEARDARELDSGS